MNSPRRVAPWLRSLPILMLSILILTACEKSSDNPSGPTEDPGEAMAARAYAVEGSMKLAFSDIQGRLNAAQAQLIGVDFATPLAGDVLENLVTFSMDHVWASGIVNDAGTVVRILPQELQGIVGEFWTGRTEVDNALSEISLNVGPRRELGGVKSVIYTRSIGTVTISGAIFAAMDLDSLISTNISFAGIDTLAEQEFFALDDTGEILYNTSGGMVGERFTDHSLFSEDQVALATIMLDVDDDRFHTSLDLTGAPGGDGERYLGWTHLQIINDHYWVLAVTTPTEEEQ